MKLTTFYKHMEGGIFKLLPLYEEQQEGQDVHLDVYMADLWDELIGAQALFPELADDVDYITILNTVRFLMDNECELDVWKRRVLKMVRMLNEMGVRARV